MKLSEAETCSIRRVRQRAGLCRVSAGHGSREPSAAGRHRLHLSRLFVLSDLCLRTDVVRIKLSCFNVVTDTFTRHISS